MQKQSFVSIRSLLDENVPVSKIAQMTGASKPDVETIRSLLDDDFYFVNELEYNAPSTEWFLEN